MISLDSTGQRDGPIHDVPDFFLEKWQGTVDTLAAIFEVPAGLIMRVLQNEIEVLVSSQTENNPYAVNERAPLKTGLYCETVMASQAMLQVPNALEDDHWKNNPDVALNMISYLGIPLFWKENEIFGTICVLDQTTRNFPKKYIDILWELKKIIESDFLIIQQQKELSSQDKEIKRILHDLRVHQIELETQNDDLRQSQVELGDAQARYFDLYDLAPVGYCTLSEKGLIREANLTATNLLGMARGDLVQQPLSRFILKEDQEIFYRIRKQLLDTCSASALQPHPEQAGQAGAVRACELRMLKKDETTFWAHLEAAVQDPVPVEACAGTYEIRIILIDITLRKQAEEALVVEHQRLQPALDEVRTLRGILPICSYCKKIRDDNGYWNRVEKYVSEHSEAKFSHGICPTCFEREVKALTDS